MGSLSRFIVLKSVDTNKYVYCMNDTQDAGGYGYVRCQEDSVFSPFTKIEIEPSKSYKDCVHIRFCNTNKYWGPQLNHTDNRIIASSDQPVDDISNPGCTLFWPRQNGNHPDEFYFTYGPSASLLHVDNTISTSPMDSLIQMGTASDKVAMFSFVDCDTLVKLPKYVTFKGDNGKFLRAVWHQNHPYLQFSGEDYNEDSAAHQVFLQPDGHVRIKSKFYDKFWRRSPNWIWGDSSDESGENVDTLFWPVKLNDNTIALRNAGNNAFCNRLTIEGQTDCLNAGTDNIITEANLVLEELVTKRSINNVTYRMEDARIYDEIPTPVGQGTATNKSNTESTMAIKVSYTVTSSTSFNKTVAGTLGVKTTIETGVPFIVDGKIEVSASVTGTLAWGEITTETRTSDATYTAKVPPMSSVTVHYVGTEGKCNVPFSYDQTDQLSHDGSFVTNRNVDGVFSGASYYSFSFVEDPVKPISS